jgi:hypothetical protein
MENQDFPWFQRKHGISNPGFPGNPGIRESVFRACLEFPEISNIFSPEKDWNSSKLGIPAIP